MGIMRGQPGVPEHATGMLPPHKGATNTEGWAVGRHSLSGQEHQAVPFSPALPGSPWKKEGRAMRWRALRWWEYGSWETGRWGHCLMDNKG